MQTKSLSEVLENNDIPFAVFSNLSDAFGCRLHPVLPDKIKYYDMKSNQLQLLKSYLQNRIHTFKWIPQGPVLSLLFLSIYIFVNDIKNCANKFDIANVSYAGDTTFISTIDSLYIKRTQINCIVSKLQHTCKHTCVYWPDVLLCGMQW